MNEIYYTNYKKYLPLLVSVIALGLLCWFCTSHIDRRRSDDLGEQLQTSQSLNNQLQKSVEDSKRAVDNSIQRIGQAETDLDRAESLISQCEQILANAKRRTQEASKKDK